MTVAAYVAGIDETLRALANDSEASAMRAYLLDQFPFLGLKAPLRRQAVAALPAFNWQSADQLIEAASLLWGKPEREFRYTAIDLLKSKVKLLDASQLPGLLGLLQRDSWWDSVDGMSAVIGALMQRQLKAGNSGVQESADQWIRHADFWVRRCAMLHQLGWRLQTDTGRLRDYAELLAEEKEFFIRKAIGWALRDYARWNPAWVRDFIRQNGSRFSGLTVREACKHLDMAGAAAG